MGAILVFDQSSGHMMKPSRRQFLQASALSSANGIVQHGRAMNEIEGVRWHGALVYRVLKQELQQGYLSRAPGCEDTHDN